MSHPSDNAPNPHQAVLAIIPARYASSRFPGKPLAMIFGKPMIQHVWERVRQVKDVDRVIIATDDERIETVARNFGAEVRLTSPDHPSGTDRLWEVARDLPNYHWILNVQGDEPFIDPSHLNAALDARKRMALLSGRLPVDILTLVTPMATFADWHNPNLVKAVLAGLDKQSNSYRALYFSRSPMPYDRDTILTNPALMGPNPKNLGFASAPPHAFRHLGLYLYRRKALETFVGLPVSALEDLEKLEQLRALEAGLSIVAIPVDSAPIGVDTPEDLSRLTSAV